MADRLSLAEAIARARPRRRRRRARGLHAPDPARRGSRADPPGPARADARADDAGHRLRPADRDGLRAHARVLLGREPGRRLAPPVARRRPVGLAGAARARRALARGHGRRLRGGSGEPPVRRPPRLHRHAARRADGVDRDRHVPVHRRGAGGGAGAAPRRRHHPRPAGGRGRERADVGDHGRAEGSRARLAARDRDGRGDRSGARAAAGRRRHPLVGARRGVRSPPAARIPRTHTTTTTATTPSTSTGTRSAGTATCSWTGCGGTSSRRPTSTSTTRRCRWPRERDAHASPPTR